MEERAQNISLVEIYLLVIFALLGAALGSFFNVCIDRLPAGKSLIHEPSHCDSCRRRLQPPDMFPVISYLALRGRCRYCRASIPRRVLAVEVIGAILVAYLYYRYDLSLQLVASMYYCCSYLVIAFIDLEHQLILNKVIYPSLVLAVVINLFIPPATVTGSFLGDNWLLFNVVHGGAALNGIMGGAAGFLLLLLVALVSRGGMAAGDVKMAAFIGLTLGLPMVVVALVLAAILGGLAAIVLLLLKVKKRKDAIPFGPFLSIATIVTFLWGQEILNWYMRILAG